MYKYPDQNHIAIAGCNEVAKICQPLQQVFNINNFAYHRYYWDGTRFTLSSRKDIAEYYYSIKGDQCRSGIPDIREPGIYFLDDYDHDTEFGKKIITPYAKNFGTSHFVVVVKHHIGVSEVIIYGVPVEYVDFNRDFLMHREFFENFLLYFKDQAKALIKIAKQTRYKFYFGEFEYIKSRTEQLQKRLQSNNDQFNFGRFYLSGEHEDIYLTRKELECLLLFYKGNNYQKIAKHLSISPITVQRHFDTIRDKFSCKNKKELKELLKKTEINFLVKQMTYNEEFEKVYNHILDSYKKDVTYNDEDIPTSITGI